MSTTDLNALHSHLQDKLETLESEYQRWNDYKQDYDALENQLKSLPDTTSRSAMIPLGKLAFMPGKIIHTNEILVLLGDQYYAERSAKQAVGILQRRREVVVENLRLAEAQLNAFKHKSDSVQSNLYPSGDQMVNEEGLPIMEIREELPPEETPKKKMEVKEQQSTNALPESVQRARDILNATPAKTNQDENKALFDLLRELEEEEENEQDEGVQQPRITEIVDKQRVEEDDSDYDMDDDDEDDEEDDEDRYDMEVSSNMFDRFDDDDEYPYDQVVDQEDFSHHDAQQQQQQQQQDEDDFNEDADRSVPKLITKKKNKPIAIENTVKEAVVVAPEEKVSEVIVSQNKKVSKFKLQRQQQQQEEEEEEKKVNVSPVKKASKFKQSLQEKQQQVEPVKTEVLTESAPTKKVSKFKLARQQVKEPEPVQNNVVEEVVPPVKKMSKFKLARQQQQQQDEVSEPVKESVIEEQVPSVKKVSKFKLARQQQQQQEPAPTKDTIFKEQAMPVKEIPEIKPIDQTQQQQESPNRHMIPQVTSSKPKRRFKPTIPTKRGGTQRKVTWDTSTSVREHDNRMAPSAVSETESYSEPIKNEETDITIRSPADIFRVVKQTQMQHQEEDGYPSFHDEDDESMEVNLNELVEAARAVPQSLWRSNDGKEMMLPIPPQHMDEEEDEEEEEEKGIIIANKSKLDTNIMKGAVMERESKPVDLERVEDDMDLKEISSSYQRKRQSMLAATGGFSFDPKPEFEVYDEDLPLPKNDNEEEEEEEEEEEVIVPKKMSRFKAARLGMKKDVEY